MSEPTSYKASGSNADAVITIAAVTSTVITLDQVSFGYDGDPTAGHLKIESPSGTILQEWPITAKGPGVFSFRDGLAGAVGQAVIITLAAAGSGVVGYVNAVRRR